MALGYVQILQIDEVLFLPRNKIDLSSPKNRLLITWPIFLPFFEKKRKKKKKLLKKKLFIAILISLVNVLFF